MRLAYAAIFALLAAVFVPYSAAAAQISEGSGVMAARIAAEQELISLGISPSDAVFQVGARNYAGSDCPGSGWNCTTAATVVQISSGAALSANVATCGSPGGDTSGSTSTQDNCRVIQSNPTGTNSARCVERSSSNPITQFCKIKQVSVSGTNKAYVEQTILQSQSQDEQNADQTARVRQFNTSGGNESTVFQTLLQNQFKSAKGLSVLVEQTEEGHQIADVCQGGALSACDPGSATTATNKSSVVQTNLQNARVDFDSLTTSLIKQDQNSDPNRGATTFAQVTQNSTAKANTSSLVHTNAQFATVYKAGHRDDDERAASAAVFYGTVEQRQGNGENCDFQLGGVCGFVTQTSTGLQTARQWQNELQKAVAPSGALQVQFGPVFCCATQNPLVGGNPNNIDTIQQAKAQFHSSSFTRGDVQGHCATSGSCSITQTLNQNGATQRNSCPGTQCGDAVCNSSNGKVCNPVITCSDEVEGTCTKTGTGAPPVPPFQCDDEDGCSEDIVLLSSFVSRFRESEAVTL